MAESMIATGDVVATDDKPLVTKESLGLVEITFTDSRGREITREVYPEIAKFVTSRKEAETTMMKANIARKRERTLFLLEKEEEWYNDPSHGVNTFDEYGVGRQWDRDHRDANPQVIYENFVSGYARNDSRFENSWRNLREDAEAAGHKTITWIIDHCMDNEHEARIILEHLPATPEELWNIAKDDYDMCGVFDRYMERAEAAGLFKDEELPASVRETRALMSYVRRTYGGNYAPELMRRVKPIIKAEREAAVADAQVKWEKDLLAKFAESNDMRELLRSLAESHPEIQKHVNRSDGARRAAETRRRNAEAQGEATNVEPATEESFA